MNKFDGLTVVKKDVNQDAVRGLEYLHKHEKGIGNLHYSKTLLLVSIYTFSSQRYQARKHSFGTKELII